jgi:hypothetical protein
VKKSFFETKIVKNVRTYPSPRLQIHVLKFKNMVDPEFRDVLNFKHVAGSPQ